MSADMIGRSVKPALALVFALLSGGAFATLDQVRTWTDAFGPPERRFILPPFSRVLPPNFGKKAANCDTMTPNSSDGKRRQDHIIQIPHCADLGDLI